MSFLKKKCNVTDDHRNNKQVMVLLSFPTQFAAFRGGSKSATSTRLITSLGFPAAHQIKMTWS